MKTLPQLLAEQRAAGLVPQRDDDDSARVLLAGQKETVSQPVTVEPEGHRTMRLPDTTTFVERRVSGQGFTRLLPPTMTTLLGATREWQAANWEAPSPWCRVEGLPDHPDFQNNLLAFQNAL